MGTILILLVEDEAILREVVQIDLAEAGFTVLSVADGAEALAELDKGATRFAAVLTDIRLGNGQDGWAVGRRARELVPEMPVIYMSGDSAPDWTSKGVPGSVMVGKPFAPAQLITALSQLITAAGPHRRD